MSLLLMFVEEGERLGQSTFKPDLEQAIDSLSNAIACRDCTDDLRFDIQRIIEHMTRELLS